MKYKLNPAKFANIVLLVPLILFMGPSCKKKSDLQISDDWINESLPASRVSAAYMKIRNQMAQDDTLLSVDCDDFEMVEFHNMYEKDGMTRMEAVDSVLIKGGQAATFEPGGMHIMLINNKRELKSGDKVNLNLHFEKMGLKKITVTVKSIQEQVK